MKRLTEALELSDAAGSTSAAARTFPARNATIGLAFRCRRIVRSVRGVGPSDLQKAMVSLNLNAASRSMSERVCFVLILGNLFSELTLVCRAFTRPPIRIDTLQ